MYDLSPQKHTNLFLPVRRSVFCRAWWYGARVSSQNMWFSKQENTPVYVLCLCCWRLISLGIITNCQGIILRVFLSLLARTVSHFWMNDTCLILRCVLFHQWHFSFFPSQLRDNIEKFFTWFVEEGKATVRLKEPAVDICLSKVWQHAVITVYKYVRERKG